MSIGKKIYFFIKIKCYFFYDWIKIAIKYYSNTKYMLFDIFFGLIYFFINPYRTARKFLEKKLQKKIYNYGETSIMQMGKIVKNFDIQPKDKILELGAGRGKISFWLNFFLKSQITAIEQIPIFVKIANFLIKTFKIKNLKFLCDDYFNHDFKGFDIIYLYGTTLNNKQIDKLITKFKKLSSSVKIITVSYSLSDYNSVYVCTKNIDIIFPWGQTKVYLNVKKG